VTGAQTENKKCANLESRGNADRRICHTRQLPAELEGHFPYALRWSGGDLIRPRASRILRD